MIRQCNNRNRVIENAKKKMKLSPSGKAVAKKKQGEEETKPEIHNVIFCHYRIMDNIFDFSSLEKATRSNDF